MNLMFYIFVLLIKWMLICVMNYDNSLRRCLFVCPSSEFLCSLPPFAAKQFAYPVPNRVASGQVIHLPETVSNRIRKKWLKIRLFGYISNRLMASISITLIRQCEITLSSILRQFEAKFVSVQKLWRQLPWYCIKKSLLPKQFNSDFPSIRADCFIIPKACYIFD